MKVGDLVWCDPPGRTLGVIVAKDSVSFYKDTFIYEVKMVDSGHICFYRVEQLSLASKNN